MTVQKILLHLCGTSITKDSHVTKIGQIRQDYTEYIRLRKIIILVTRNGNYKDLVSSTWHQLEITRVKGVIKHTE